MPSTYTFPNLVYIDFKNAFGLIDHTSLLAIMKDLGYLKDVVKYRYKEEQNKVTFLVHIYLLCF